MKNRIVWGRHSVQSVLEQSPEQAVTLWLQKPVNSSLQPLVQLAKSLALDIRWLDHAGFKQRFGEAAHQGIGLTCQAPANLRDEKQLSDHLKTLDKPPLLLALDGVQDPHNLGACLRTADAAGVDGVLLTSHRSATITPVVSKVACGAVEHLALFNVVNLPRALKSLQQQGFWIAGTADEESQSLYQADANGPLVVVMGNEGQGLRRLTREQCDFLWSIPMQGHVSSLNVSVATGVVLFELQRQRQNLTLTGTG